MQQLRVAAQSVDDDLRQLGAVASAQRRGEQLVALAVGAHSVCLERLVALSPDPALLEDDPEISEVLRVHRPSPPEEQLLDGFAERVDAMVAAIEQTGVPGMADTANRLLDTIGDVYGSVVARALELLHRAGHGHAIRAALGDDVISSALVVYGLHPHDLETRAIAAIDAVNSTLSDLGPRAVFSGVDDDGTVRLRMEGEPIRDRWRVAVAAERAVIAVTPDAAGTAVDGVNGDAPAVAEAQIGSTEVFIPLSTITRRGDSRPSRWIECPALAVLTPGDVAQVLQGDLRLLACNVDGDLYVAPDPFGNESLDLQVSAAGTPSVSSPSGVTFVFTDPLPVQRDGDLIEVAVP